MCKQIGRYFCMLMACIFCFLIIQKPIHAEIPNVMISKGKIKFDVTSTAAMSGIKYKTVGWTVRRDEVCKNCDPTGDGAASIEGIEQVAQNPDPPRPGQLVTTYFEIPEATVSKALTDHGMEAIKQNDQLYLYAIMVVTQNGRQISGPYYTLDAIKHAQAWAHPDDLDDYYDIPVTYDSPDFPVDVVCKTVDGTTIAEPSCSFHKGDYKAGENIDYTFKKEVQSSDRTYEIVRSYIVSKNNPERKTFIREQGEDNLLDRHISVYISGADIVAEYQEVENPVKAIYQTEDGTELKEVDKGNFSTGEAVDHTFEERISKDGKEYEIVRSYIINLNEPDQKQFVQEKTDPHVLDRHITVASGGSNFVGIYKIPSSVTVTSRIQAPTDTDEANTEVNGDFIFDAKALTELKSYEITNIKNASLVHGGDKAGTLNGTSANKTIPIKVQMGTSSSVTVQVTVVVTDVDGHTGDSTADHTIQRNTSNGGFEEGGGGVAGCSPPSRGAIRQAQIMDPAATGVIKANHRGDEKFDVLQGIPTSESLYVNAIAKNYLYKNEFAEMSGTCTYPIKVTKTYTLRWTEIHAGPPDATGNPTIFTVPHSDTQMVTKDYQIVRKYDYWQIDNLEVYGIQQAAFTNYALPSGSVTVRPSGYSPPMVSAQNSDSLGSHMSPPTYTDVTLPNQTVYGGSSRPSVPNEDWKGVAERAVGKIKVHNDSVVFNGATIMDSGVTEEKAPTPGIIPAPTITGQDVLYGEGYTIDQGKTNKANTPSSGTIKFSLIKGIKGGADKSFSIGGLNTVTVHTPVVNYATVSDDQAHNQKTSPDTDRSALILDRPFTVTVLTDGQHRNIPGYGNRDYAKYVKDKQVWFPFDVFKADKSSFIPKETWVSIPVNQDQMTFFLPTWVDEGNYDVLFRTIAENSPSSGFSTQMNANLDVANHVATQVTPVEVIGRVFDFKVTDVADFNWETVFRKQKGSSEPTGNAYWVGIRGIDGTPRGNSFPYVLPIREGSHPDPGKKNIAVKTGYHIKFDLKTIGNMYGLKDGIRITPTFYFVDANGQNRQEVDLYYRTNDNPFVRIGSGDDVEKRYVTLDARLRNIPQQEIINTANSLWNLYANEQGWTIDHSSYVNQFLKNAKKPTYVGGYDIEILPPTLRTFIGSMTAPSGVDVARANASVQQWHGEYSLPAAPYVVPKGTNLAEYGRTHRLDDNAPIFLKNGFIIVNFNIETIQNQNLEHPHLQYIHAPLSNQWRMEGFQSSFTDPYGVTFQLKDGDVVFYNADLSSYDDFGSGVTH